jgi:steroid delta-isomerase-like uncharacterized protein
MSTATASPSVLKQNKEMILRVIEDVWGKGNLKLVDELYDTDYTNYQHHHPDSPQVIRGAEAWKKFVAEFRQAFPDFGNEIDDQLAEGNLVATRFVSSGTQRGEIMGNPPTNKKISWTGIQIDRIIDGKIVESWVNWDMAGMLNQMRSA